MIQFIITFASLDLIGARRVAVAGQAVVRADGRFAAEEDGELARAVGPGAADACAAGMKTNVQLGLSRILNVRKLVGSGSQRYRSSK